MSTGVLLRGIENMEQRSNQNDPMKITVILCTYNRHQSVQSALSSVAASLLPESVEWEVVGVDNNSSDQTRKVAEEFGSRYPGRCRYLFEAQPSKSHAPNTDSR